MLKIPIIATFNNIGIKKASKDIDKFGNGVTKTFKKMGLASKFSIAGISASLALLAKQSVAAAMAEEKAVKSLALTLKNLGIRAADKRVNDFIETLQRSSGVSEDLLRPAFQRLVTVTKDVAQSQSLLGLAMDLSAGTGKSLDTVVMALTKAYNGSNTSLSRLGVNLTKAELKTLTFDQVTYKLAQTFKGQASQAADTFQGRVNRLSVAADEAKETIGVALTGALDNMINQAGGVDSLTQSMNLLAIAAAGVVEATNPITGALAKITNMPGRLSQLSIDLATGLSKAFGGNTLKGFAAERSSEDKRMFNRVQNLKDLQSRKKITKPTLSDKQIAANKALAAKFDQDMIQIEAALKGKLTEEERTRLLALKALKTESKNDDIKALEELDALQKKSAAERLAQIKTEEQARTDALAKQKSEYQALTEWLKSNPINVYTEFTNSVGQKVTVPAGFGVPGTNVSSEPPATNASNYAPPSTAQQNAIMGTTPSVTVNVNAGTIADENKLTYIIADQIVKYVRFGGVTAPAGFI